METVQESIKKFLWRLARATAALYVALGGFMVYAVNRANDADQRLERETLANCKEIEDGKKLNREQAIKTYKDLDQTLRILKLEKTPEIVKLARENRDKLLKRFAALPCPRA